jgi:hypothetical protein
MDHAPDDDLPSASRSRFADQLFTVGNLAVFLILLTCVAVAAVFWELSH